MKYILSLISFISFGAMAGTATNTATTNYVENTAAPTFVTPMTMGGGDVMPSYATVTTTSATCPSNQLILDVVGTDSELKGSGAPKIGNYGSAVGVKIVIPFGDNGGCKTRTKLINRGAELAIVRSRHNLCMGSAESFKKSGMFLDEEYFEAWPDMRQCRKIFIMAGIAYKQP